MKPKITVVIPLAEGSDCKVLNTLKKQIEKVEVIIEKGNNPSENRNKGIKKAKTSLIAFVNGHTTLPIDWSKKVRIFFEKHKEWDIIGGPQLTPKDASYFEKISGYALASKFGSGNVNTRYGGKRFILNADERFLTSANLICRKKVFKKIRFDEDLYPGEDPKFISDAKKHRFKIVYAPSIIAYNERRDKLKDFFIQNFNYGKSRPKKESFAETLAHPMFMIPSLFVIYLILLPLLISVNILLTTPLVLYLFFSIFFSSYESVKNKDLRAIFVLPIIFLLIHISYGLGFIYGLFKK